MAKIWKWIGEVSIVLYSNTISQINSCIAEIIGNFDEFSPFLHQMSGKFIVIVDSIRVIQLCITFETMFKEKKMHTPIQSLRIFFIGWFNILLGWRKSVTQKKAQWKQKNRSKCWFKITFEGVLFFITIQAHNQIVPLLNMWLCATQPFHVIIESS